MKLRNEKRMWTDHRDWFHMRFFKYSICLKITKNLPKQAFHLTHCEVGQANDFGKAVFEPVVLS